MISKDEIIKRLSGEYLGKKSNLIITMPIDIEGEYNRDIEIETELGDKFKIKWWTNISYLHFGNLIMPFTDIYLSSTWPNNYMLNIQGSYNSKDTTFIIPIRNQESAEKQAK